MRILIVNVVCGIKSTGRICTDLAEELDAQGHEVKIAYGRDTVSEKFSKYAVRIGSDFDVKLHGVKARLYDASGFGSEKATYRFIEWVKSFDPDLIHLHNIHGYYLNVDILFRYLKTCHKKLYGRFMIAGHLQGIVLFVMLLNVKDGKQDVMPVLKKMNILNHL